ncbi:MAG: GDSL-type esterase/lipase family protein [Candidatus Bathyarchaeia archaeon]|jgi:lysophospholipase L1-like esterase
MDKNKLMSVAVVLIVVLLVSSALAAFFILSSGNKKPPQTQALVACVGDSITQSTAYPYDLWMLLGTTHYVVENFGAGSTTVSLESQTPYMNTTVFQNALASEPNIVIIMLGTNDAQPSLLRYNASFVSDYVKLVDAFSALKSNPKIWLVFPPPIFSNQSGRLDPGYFNDSIIPGIRQVANETGLPTINVYSALANYSGDFPDGEHPNDAAAQIIANTVYSAIT